MKLERIKHKEEREEREKRKALEEKAHFEAYHEALRKKNRIELIQ